MAPRIRRRLSSPGTGWPDAIPPLLRRIYAARGIDDPTLARPRLAQLPSPDALGGVVEAVRLLADAIARDTRILVVGDFDADGATA
ncbi:MAG: single-stranded-DNA-specific exonuclease RecJ, partial [Bacteroidota bacterium]